MSTQEPKRRFADSGLSPAEQLALAWHQEHHGDESCWCCCKPCRQKNPHHEEARRSATQDIAERLKESILSAKLPGKPRPK